jgi:phosphoribosyl 1,2-cyclic phosphodiesterase
MKWKSTIKILGSGSSGNCALIYDSRGKCIILDLGLSWKDINEGLDSDISNVSAALVTHAHFKDHSKSVLNALYRQIKVYGNEDICSKYKGCRLMKPKLKYNIDGFKIETFELVHNVPNNAFIIDTYDGIRILYCTDTQIIPEVIHDVNYAIIECNYDFDIVFERGLAGKDSASHFEYHHSLQNCIEYLSKINHPNLRQVIISHLSDSNSDERKFKQKIFEELGINVLVADKEVKVELNKEDF